MAPFVAFCRDDGDAGVKGEEDEGDGPEPDAVGPSACRRDVEAWFAAGRSGGIGRIQMRSLRRLCRSRSSSIRLRMSDFENASA